MQVCGVNGTPAPYQTALQHSAQAGGAGLGGDGGELAMKALSLGQAGMPFLAFNSLRNDSEKSEQSGLMNLMVGMFSTFRNTTAHAPRLHWQITEQDALDLLTMASFLHRRLDAAVRTPRT